MPYRSPALTAAIAAVVLLLAGLQTAAFAAHHTGGRSASTAGASADGSTRLAGWRLYVDRSSSAARAAAAYRAAGRTERARLLARIAARPTASWITSEEALPEVDAALAGARRQGQEPVFVAYDMVGRDCGSYSAGGAASADAYRAWVSALASRIGDRRAVVVLEPDAVAQALTCASGSASTRYSLLRDAVTVLSRHSGTRVYLDAGNSGWVSDAGAVAAALRSSGVGRAAGFSLNVSNFQTTRSSIAYGRRISRRLGGTHFVVDTGRNGSGPAVDDALAWCNPPGRSLGRSPTTATGHRLVDAYLWVKPPGESDGACRAGAPQAGTFWPAYAVGMARNAGWR